MLHLLLLPVALAASPLDGSWVLSSDINAVRAAQKAAADRALASVPEIFRPLGARILAPTFKVCASYVIKRTEELSIQCEAAPPIRSTLDGVTRTVQVAGEPRPVSMVAEGEGAALTIHNDNGARTTRYAPTATGLHVSVAITSSHLDVPIGWDLDYRLGP